MPEVFYTDVVWTAGDIITEAKMDNMVANDRAVDAMDNGVQLTERADPATPSANTLHLYAKDKSGVSSLYFIDDSGAVTQLGDVTPTFGFPIPGTLVVGASMTSAIIVPKPLTIKKAYGYVKGAPTGTPIIFDILKNSSSIWNSTPANRLTIGVSTQTASQTLFDTVALVEGDILTLDVIQIGSGSAGNDATVELKTQ